MRYRRDTSMGRGRRGPGLLAVVFVLCPLGDAAAQTSDDLFNDAVLHRIDLYVHSRDWQQLKANYQLNDYYPAHFTWQGQTSRNAGIRSRGLGSRSGVKPGFRVDFDHYVTGQRFLGLKALVLDNLTQDPSFLRELLSMKLFRRLGHPASREAHAELYVNNTFAGLYAVVEDVDDVAAQRFYGDGSGYLYEYKWTYEYRYEYLGPQLEPYAALFEPKTRELESNAALYTPIEKFVRAVNETSGEEFEQTMAEYLEWDPFLQYLAIQNFVAEIDGLLGAWGLANFYLYRQSGELRQHFIPWDADNAFASSEHPVLWNADQNILTRRAMEVPSLKQLFYDRLLEAGDSAAEVGEDSPVDPETGRPLGWLEQEVVRHYELVRETARRDQLKPFTNDQFEEAVAGLVSFARQRTPFVRCEVGRLTDPSGAPVDCAAQARRFARRPR